MAGQKREARFREGDPAIHAFLIGRKQDVDARVIGERKRRRPSDSYARA
jgi:hypothetical protein